MTQDQATRLSDSQSTPAATEDPSLSIEFQIQPESKVAAVLEHFPELEDVLIAMAPPFKKLRNPILRKSVAKVASLRQAAAVGRIPVDELVNRLRAEVGQAQTESPPGRGEEPDYFGEQPEWFQEAKVVETFVEENLDPNVMPLTPLLQRAKQMEPGEILALVTTYLPAPGIDIMRNKGFGTWSVTRDELIETYFYQPMRGEPG